MYLTTGRPNYDVGLGPALVDAADHRDRTDRSDRIDPTNRVDPPVHIGAAEHLDRVDRSDRADHVDRSDRIDRADRSDRVGTPMTGERRVHDGRTSGKRATDRYSRGRPAAIFGRPVPR